MIEPLGEFSPMGLMWTFMGYSKGYNRFVGGAEMLGGILLRPSHHHAGGTGRHRGDDQRGGAELLL